RGRLARGWVAGRPHRDGRRGPCVRRRRRRRRQARDRVLTSLLSPPEGRRGGDGGGARGPTARDEPLRVTAAPATAGSRTRWSSAGPRRRAPAGRFARRPSPRPRARFSARRAGPGRPPPPAPPPPPGAPHARAPRHTRL